MAPSAPRNQVSAEVSDRPGISSARCAACETAQLFGSFIETGPSVVLCLSPEHRILEFNRAAERLFGQKRDAVLGHEYVRLFVPATHRNAVTGTLRRALHDGATGVFETSDRTLDGAERVMRWSVSRVLDATGQPRGVIVIGQDMTEHRAAGERLRRYEHIVHTSSDLMAFVSADYVYEAANAAYLEAFGKTEDQTLGHPMAAVLGETVFHTQVKPDMDRCLSGERVNAENWFDLPSGRRCLESHLDPFRDPGGAVAGVVIDGRDITEHRQAERVLTEHQQRLRTLASEVALAGQRERRRVAAGLHDQVGQALAMAKLKLGTALSSELPVEARRALEESQALLTQSIQSTRSLTFQLSSAVLQELGLGAALQQLIEWFDGENDDTRFVFETDTPAKPLGVDQGFIVYDIARELLFNIVKYARASSASLALEQHGDQIRITIEDDGVGFDTACLSEGHSADGGFGYFNIREQIAYLGGEFELESSIGHGTRVVATVPLAASCTPPTRVP